MEIVLSAKSSTVDKIVVFSSSDLSWSPTELISDVFDSVTFYVEGQKERSFAFGSSEDTDIFMNEDLWIKSVEHSTLHTNDCNTKIEATQYIYEIE